MQLQQLAAGKGLPSCFNPHRPRRADATISLKHGVSREYVFQSSPAPKGRCNKLWRQSMPGDRRFNPHRPRRADATARMSPASSGNSVFQSSPAPKGRCNGEAALQLHVSPCFNPHRPRRADATSASGPWSAAFTGFNPHRPRRADATRTCTRRISATRTFQSSPAPKGRCNLRQAVLQAGHGVSILTGPEGPMQRATRCMWTWTASSFNPHRPRRADATSPSSSRSGGASRFNPHRPRRADATSGARPRARRRCGFQSSPAPKGRCNPADTTPAGGSRGFNPHRPRRADATCRTNRDRRQMRVSILTGPEGPMQRALRGVCATHRGFNPHRPRRADATGGRWCMCRLQAFQSSPAPKGRCNLRSPGTAALQSLFQSSPAPKGRCNFLRPVRGHRLALVSILTGPEGPMQHRRRNGHSRTAGVSILTGPEGPMQHIRLHGCARAQVVSILTGPEGPMQPTGPLLPDAMSPFQSSPAPKGRCNAAGPSRLCVHTGFNPHRPRRADATSAAALSGVAIVVSILTGPEGPMQQDPFGGQ